MPLMTHAGRHGNGEAQDAHRDRARARKNDAVRAQAGAETIPAVTDSLGASISNASPLTFEEREAAKKKLQ